MRCEFTPWRAPSRLPLLTAQQCFFQQGALQANYSQGKLFQMLMPYWDWAAWATSWTENINKD